MIEADVGASEEYLVELLKIVFRGRDESILHSDFSLKITSMLQFHDFDEQKIYALVFRQ